MMILISITPLRFLFHYYFFFFFSLRFFFAAISDWFRRFLSIIFLSIFLFVFAIFRFSPADWFDYFDDYFHFRCRRFFHDDFFHFFISLSFISFSFLIGLIFAFFLLIDWFLFTFSPIFISAWFSRCWFRCFDVIFFRCWYFHCFDFALAFISSFQAYGDFFADFGYWCDRLLSLIISSTWFSFDFMICFLLIKAFATLMCLLIFAFDILCRHYFSDASWWLFHAFAFFISRLPSFHFLHVGIFLIIFLIIFDVGFIFMISLIDWRSFDCWLTLIPIYFPSSFSISCGFFFISVRGFV